MRKELPEALSRLPVHPHTLIGNNFSSPRRFEEQGIVKTCVTYMLNYWWPVLFHRPYTPGHHDLKRS